jgi:putative ABC transport system substrate-binding protein
MMTSGLAHSDAARKLPLIGEVWFSNPSIAGPYDLAFRDGLRELGYVDGKNVTIVTRYANGDVAQVPVVLDQLISLPVDVIAVSPKAVQVARQKTATIPIVCPDMGNPVRDGLVASLAHPGGNLTGGYALDTETNAKRLELTIEIAPGTKTLGVMFDGNDMSLVQNAKALRALAQTVGVSVRTFAVRDWNEIQTAFSTIERDRVQALMIFDNPLTEAHLEAIMRYAAHRLPVVSEGRDWAKAGALLAYGADYHDMWKHSAVFVDKILKGAKPGDLPVEQPTKFDLLVNMRTAKALGIAVPESILLRADEIIR